MDPAELASLTEAEKEVLRLFLETSDPKEIAARIGRSPHAVDKRLRSARSKLAVSRTADAARKLALAERGEGYETTSGRPFVSRLGERHDLIEPPSERAGLVRLFPTRGRPWNAEPAWLRMLVIAACVALLITSAVLSVSLGEAISRIARH